MAKAKPLLDNVVLRSGEEDGVRTPGGIVLPGSTVDGPCVGLVEAVGPGGFDATGKRIPMDISEGQRVLFRRGHGTRFGNGKDEVTIVPRDSILAVLE